MPKTVITFGTFDLFHPAHINILYRAKLLAEGGRLVVGVSTDQLTFEKKQRYPIIDQEGRKKILRHLSMVDEVFDEESLDLKGEYIKRYQADVLVMGDDWRGKFDQYQAVCEVVYLPRTEGISTTDIIKKILASPALGAS